MIRATALAALLALVACDLEYADIEVTSAFHREAIIFLDALQPASIAENREYCGYFGLDDMGAFAATDPVPGGPVSCDLPRNAPGIAIVASYHTHAAFDPVIDGELPSVNDVMSDIEHGTHGYIATPAGRVWFIDWQARTARQVCGPGCVARDPSYDGGVFGPVAPFYTLTDLIGLEGVGG